MSLTLQQRQRSRVTLLETAWSLFPYKRIPYVCPRDEAEQNMQKRQRKGGKYHHLLVMNPTCSAAKKRMQYIFLFVRICFQRKKKRGNVIIHGSFWSHKQKAFYDPHLMSHSAVMQEQADCVLVAWLSDSSTGIISLLESWLPGYFLLWGRRCLLNPSDRPAEGSALFHSLFTSWNAPKAVLIVSREKMIRYAML